MESKLDIYAYVIYNVNVKLTFHLFLRVIGDYQ
jgi:hypothetical protein